MCDPVRIAVPEDEEFEGDPSLGGTSWKGEVEECVLGLQKCTDAGVWDTRIKECARGDYVVYTDGSMGQNG